jgi:hypothetical protein
MEYCKHIKFLVKAPLKALGDATLGMDTSTHRTETPATTKQLIQEIPGIADIS